MAGYIRLSKQLVIKKIFSLCRVTNYQYDFKILGRFVLTEDDRGESNLDHVSRGQTCDSRKTRMRNTMN